MKQTHVIAQQGEAWARGNDQIEALLRLNNASRIKPNTVVEFTYIECTGEHVWPSILEGKLQVPTGAKVTKFPYPISNAMVEMLALSHRIGQDIDLNKDRHQEESESKLKKIATIKEDSLFNRIKDELESAAKKFPRWPSDPMHAMGILNEEVGELNKEVLQACYEPEEAATLVRLVDVRAEAVQVAAMAIQFIKSMSAYDFEPSQDHERAL